MDSSAEDTRGVNGLFGIEGTSVLFSSHRRHIVYIRLQPAKSIMKSFSERGEESWERRLELRLRTNKKKVLRNFRAQQFFTSSIGVFSRTNSRVPRAFVAYHIFSGNSHYVLLQVI
jgi:hypothetical protein